MKALLFYAGRIFQLIGLLALPSAIWAAEFLHSEPISVGILIGSVLVFALGWAFASAAKK